MADAAALAAIMRGPVMPAPVPPTRIWAGELAHHAADEIIEWCHWHIARAKARGLPAEAEAELDAVLAAAAEVAFAIEEGDPFTVADGDDSESVEKAREALHGAIDQAKWGAEERCGGWRAGQPIDPNAMAQCTEVETSFLRGWARELDSIAVCAESATDAPDLAAAWYIEALRSIAFFAPPRFQTVQESFE